MSSQPSSTSTLPLPYLYTCSTDSKGRVYYQNHALGRTTWLHPLKLSELQSAGYVAPSLSSSPFTTKYTASELASLPSLSASEITGDVATEGIRPEALERGKNGREGVEVRKVKGGEIDGVMLPDGEEWTRKGELPPWVVEEWTVAGEGEEGRPYWVDYRTDEQNDGQSPLHRAEARGRLRRMRESGKENLDDEPL